MPYNEQLMVCKGMQDEIHVCFACGWSHVPLILIFLIELYCLQWSFLTIPCILYLDLILPIKSELNWRIWTRCLKIANETKWYKYITDSKDPYSERGRIVLHSHDLRPSFISFKHYINGKWIACVNLLKPQGWFPFGIPKPIQMDQIQTTQSCGGGQADGRTAWVCLCLCL